MAKHAVPASKKKIEEIKFFGLSLRFPSAPLEALPVADKKRTRASATAHKEIILTGALKTARRTKTSTGYKTPAMASRIFILRDEQVDYVLDSLGVLEHFGVDLLSGHVLLDFRKQVNGVD